MFSAARKITRPPPARQQQAIPETLPAPIGGVNARDSLALMPPTDCILGDNWFGTPSDVRVRNGCQSWATGLPGAVNTVMAYNGLSARKLFAASTDLYDVTTQGAVGAAVVSALTSDQFQHAMFNAGGGNVLLCVNGADSPLRYDGGTQGALLTLNTLVGGASYTAGTYTGVSLTGGTGSGAKATIVVASGAVTTVTVTTPGSGYKVADTLSATAASIGGTGSGFSIKVETVGGWSTTTISGTNTVTGNPLSPAALITVTVFKQRVWYIEANTMNVWYSTVLGYQGTLTLFPMGTLFKKGGTLMQMATWTVDNVSGMDDYAAFITTEGEVAIYQGYDPAQLSTWSLVGIFQIGRPIGRRCYTKYASDILVLTADGLTPLSKAMLTDRTQQNTELTDKIRNAINADVQSFNANFGWQVIEYPLGNKLIVNVPEAVNSTVHQWVMNDVTKAWWRFKAWNANCWELQQDSLYFGANQAVYLADTGYSDAGNTITADCKPAFSYFKRPGMNKEFLMARPVFLSSANIQPVVTLNIDFNDVQSAGVPFSSGGVAPWDTSPWDVTPWGDITASIPIKNWQGVTGYGYAASGRLTLQIKGIALQWYSIDYLFAEGGPL